MSDIIDGMRAMDLDKIEMLFFLLTLVLLCAVYYLWRDKQASVEAELTYLRSMFKEYLSGEDEELATAMLTVEALKRIEARLERLETGPRRGRL